MDQDASLFSRLSSDARLQSLADDPRPAIVWRSDGRAIVWSNTAGARLLGLALSDIAGNGAALSAATLAPQIAETSRRLTSRDAIRLERLRFPGPGRLEAIACSCRRLTLGDHDALVLVIALSEPLWLRGSAYRALLSPLGPDALAPVARDAAHKVPAATVDGSVSGQGAPSGEADAPSQNETPDAPPDRLPARFVFQLDADGRFASLSSDLATIIGDGAGRWMGRLVMEIGTVGEEARARLARAISSHTGFTRHGLDWVDPVAGVVTEIELNAAPMRDGEGSVSGFRGFGLCRAQHPMAVVASAPVIPPTIETVAAEEEVPAVEEPSADSPVETNRRILAALQQALHPRTTDTGRRAEPPPPADDEDEDEPAPSSARPPVEPFSGPRIVVFPDTRPDSEPKIITLRPGPTLGEPVVLSPSERNAFREIARALGARLEGDDTPEPAHPSPDVGRDEIAWADDAAAETARPVDPVRSMRAQFRQAEGLDARATDQTPRPDRDAPVDERIETAEALRSETTSPPSVPADAAAPTPLRESADLPDDLQVALPADVPAVSEAFTQLLDKLPVSLLIVRGDTTVFANRSLLDLAGYETLAAFEQAGGAARLFAGQGMSGVSGQSQLLVATARGDRIAVDGRMQLIDWLGEPAQLFTLRVPVEEEALGRLRRAESEVAAATRRADELQAVLDTATDGVVIVDGEGAIIGINRSAEALFGVEATEVAGESFVILIAPESHRSAIDYLDGLRRNGVASVLNDGREIVGRVRQGGRVPLFMTMGRLGDGDRFCAVLRDITQFKKAEQELIAAKRQAEVASSHKSDFLAKVSHEIRTPLNAIIGFAEVMMEERFGAIGNDRYRSYMRDIHSAGEHVMGLVNDLLDLAKIEAGRLELSFAAIALNDIIEQCVAIMQPQANRERILIRTSLSRSLPNIVADARTLRQVVLNLLSNSIKFTPKGGQVIVSTTLNDSGEAVMRVRDTGIGMSDKELSVALEPFGQVKSSQNGGGTGLGLPLTKALVEANRATFVIQSAKNNGTLVEVIFPPTRVLAE